MVIGFLTKNSSDVPTAADSTPTCNFYASDDLQAKSNPISATVSAITGETGGYVISLTTSSLTAGVKYTAIIAYAISSANKREMCDFTLS